MAISYKIFNDLNFCYIKASGSVNSEEIKSDVQTMFDEKEWNFGINIIVDYRDVLKLVVTKEDIDKIIEMEEVNEKFLKHKGERGKMAFVLTNDIYELIARLYAAKARNLKKEINIFRLLDDAIKWIGLKKIPPEILQR